MSKAVIEITSTGEGDKVHIEVSFNGKPMDLKDPAHITAMRIAEAIYRGDAHEALSKPEKVEALH